MSEEQSDPRKNPPSERSSSFLRIGSGALAVLAGGMICLGAVAIARPKTRIGVFGLETVGSRGEGFLNLGAGLVSLGIAHAGWKHADFANLVRKANRVDELLLERASVDRELEEARER